VTTIHFDYHPEYKIDCSQLNTEQNTAEHINTLFPVRAILSVKTTMCITKNEIS